ncbi:MAG: NUDIX hydrolase, partial [Gammaproteobacteria bacterium]|nr:NUDIX hydrolase [Gammaproteobacteria bacterium]
CRGMHALPGGFVDLGETTKAACLRELKEEAGIEINDAKFIGVYDDPKRDPGRHSVSIAYVAQVGDVTPQAGDDAATAEFLDWQDLNLAFDHRRIIKDALSLA